MLLPTKYILSIFLFVLLTASLSVGAPVQKIQGVIVGLEEDHLWLKPDGSSEPLKFILKWMVRFNPPRLPLKGDRVQILYKDKDEGAVIYGMNYLEPSSDSETIPERQ